MKKRFMETDEMAWAEESHDSIVYNLWNSLLPDRRNELMKVIETGDFSLEKLAPLEEALSQVVAAQKELLERLETAGPSRTAVLTLIFARLRADATRKEIYDATLRATAQYRTA